MPQLSSITLIVFGGIWLFYAYPKRIANMARSYSDAAQLESDLKRWADQNATKEAVDEIFVNGYSLALGSEATNRGFEGMIRDSVARSSVPGWPGVLAVLIGTITLVVLARKENRPAEQVGTSDGEKPPN